MVRQAILAVLGSSEMSLDREPHTDHADHPSRCRDLFVRMQPPKLVSTWFAQVAEAYSDGSVIENDTRESDPIQALRNGNLMRLSDTDPVPAWIRQLTGASIRNL